MLRRRRRKKCSQFGACRSNNLQTVVKKLKAEPSLYDGCHRCHDHNGSFLVVCTTLQLETPPPKRKTQPKSWWSDDENLSEFTDLLFNWDSSRDCLTQACQSVPINVSNWSHRLWCGRFLLSAARCLPHITSYDRKTSLYFSKDNSADGPAYQQDNKLTEAVLQRPETVLLLLLGKYNKSSVFMLILLKLPRWKATEDVFYLLYLTGLFKSS